MLRPHNRNITRRNLHHTTLTTPTTTRSQRKHEQTQEDGPRRPGPGSSVRHWLAGRYFAHAALAFLKAVVPLPLAEPNLTPCWLRHFVYLASAGFAA